MSAAKSARLTKAAVFFILTGVLAAAAGRSVVHGQTAQRHYNPTAITAGAVPIPELDSGYIPQGVAWYGDRLVLSHYDKAGKRPSLISVVSRNGNVESRIELFEVNGKPHKGHVGGAAVEGQILWTGSGGRILRFRLPPTLTDRMKLKAETSFPVDSRASFCSIGNGYLWIGDFCRPPRCETARHHHAYGKTAWIAAYKLDQAGNLASRDRYVVDGRSMLKPDMVLLIDNSIQGMAICSDAVVLSESYGPANSRLKVYVAPFAKEPEFLRVGGVRLPAYVLDRTIHNIPMPAGMEDLEWNGSHLAAGFESGAKFYRTRWRGATIESRVLLIDFERISRRAVRQSGGRSTRSTKTSAQSRATTPSKPVASILNEVNDVRRKHGLSAVSFNKQLSVAAQHHADWMQRQGRATHKNAEAAHLEGEMPKTLEEWKSSTWHPINRAIQAGFLKLSDVYEVSPRNMKLKPGSKSRIGEVISIVPDGNPALVTAAHRVKSWLGSEYHRKTVLGDFKYAGAGISANRRYVVAVFGK